MKRQYFISLSIFAAICIYGLPLFGQNYLSESFDGTSLPTGWSASTYVSPTSGCASVYGCAWNREPTGTGHPAVATHSGAGYMFYNSYAIDVGGSAELRTPAINFSTYSTGYNQVSFWMFRNPTAFLPNSDSLEVLLNTSSSSSGAYRLGVINADVTLAPVEISAGWYQYVFTIPSSFSGSTNYIFFKAFSGFGYDIHIDDVSIDHVPPCSSAPTLNITPAGPLTGCVGAIDTLQINLGSLASSLQYQWQVSYDTGLTWLNIVNDTGQNTVALALKTILYRAKVTCKLTGATSTSSPVTVFATGPKVKYAKLPYEQSFESWMDHCDSKDVPDSSWTIYPASGNDAWRRDDQGVTNGSWSGSTGLFMPSYYDTAHSARFHTVGSSFDSRGEMDLYIDCSADTVHGKELRFFYYNPFGDDNVGVYLSTDSGLTFSNLTYAVYTYKWSQYMVPFFSKSKNTVLKFCATSDMGPVPDTSDIGIDKVQVLAPCTGKPTAGSINPVNPCNDIYFMLSLTGATEAADLIYKWQVSTDSTIWTTLPDSNAVIQTIVHANSYFRVIVKCAATGLTDTSKMIYAPLKPFYYCYCNPNESYEHDVPVANIGNFTIRTLPSTAKVLDNGSASLIILNSTAINSYSNFDSTISTPTLYLDTLYSFSVSEISQYISVVAAPVNMWIDMNHDGVFEPAEILMNRSTGGLPSSASVADTFTIPDTTHLGITGLRVKLGVKEEGPLQPCSTVTLNSKGELEAIDTVYGEYEDYLINISLPPCYGILKVGKISSSDTTVCSGYPFLLTDTSYDHSRTSVTRIWQLSGDGLSWYDVPGSANRDTLTQIFSGSVWYRVRMICVPAADTAYSDTLHITLSPPYRCYCASYADGISRDTSDIGGFSMAGFVVNKGGPHIGNSAAVYSRQDYSKSIIDLWVDTTYQVDVYYILHHGVEAYSRVTLFMDFDNSHTYDIPQERVMQTVTSSLSPAYILDTVTIPSTVITGVPTGMRLIVNNNTAPNVPSDEACGTYTSGETMDFAVRFNVSHLGVGNISGLKRFSLYPNPTDGKFAIAFEAQKTIQRFELHITNMMGCTVIDDNYLNVAGKFNTVINMSGYPTGIYFAEITADGEKMIRKLVIR